MPPFKAGLVVFLSSHTLQLTLRDCGPAIGLKLGGHNLMTLGSLIKVSFEVILSGRLLIFTLLPLDSRIGLWIRKALTQRDTPDRYGVSKSSRQVSCEPGFTRPNFEPSKK
ncbi:hypothetical protein F5Y16DRAFT_392880 [Xylariaceae sp. FL0255]|nr:hypothetical protein F5Y16DRAFT_392880 [Xylariaceae sp. FL0255]